MFQNHILQLMMLTAMEAPVRYTGEMVRNEKVKVLQAVRPYKGSDFAEFGVRGQYTGYSDEQGIPDESQTETFAALKLYIDNWRWKGVPFYLRSGKAMSCRTTQIVIQFREPPHMLFGEHKSYRPEANRLVVQIQPAEGIQLDFQSKVPDSDMKMRLSNLDFRFDTSGKELPDAYQRLLLDVLNGDPGLFARSDEVEQAWRIIDPIISAWKSPAAPTLFNYEPGMWGPEEGVEWMTAQGRSWFDVCPVI
jgi:glucose-6-phosphate 1-dehydrogenase